MQRRKGEVKRAERDAFKGAASVNDERGVDQP